MGARQKLREPRWVTRERDRRESPVTARSKRCMEGFTDGQMSTPGEEEEHREGSRHSSDPGETLGPRGGGAATPCKAILQVLNRLASGGGDKELAYLQGHADREDRRRELERGAWSSEGEVQTHRPKGHPKMRDRGAPCLPPGERRTSGRGERGCSKRTL